MKYKDPKSTVDIIVVINECILLIKRKNAPFKNKWALPGGFIDYGKETLEEAAIRELKEETNLKAKTIYPVGNFSEPKRDPRGHVISHVFKVIDFAGEAKAADDAKEVEWFDLTDLPKLAFDHKKIIKECIL